MRQAFVHEADLAMPAEADAAAPGAAVTVALCGRWDHEPPCPLAPHHSQATRSGDDVHLRILFAAEPEHEDLVRSRIHDALDAGQTTDPAGGTVRWRLRAARPGTLLPEESSHAERLTLS